MNPAHLPHYQQQPNNMSNDSAPTPAATETEVSFRQDQLPATVYVLATQSQVSINDLHHIKVVQKNGRMRLSAIYKSGDKEHKVSQFIKKFTDAAAPAPAAPAEAQ
jgi:hypothetical protein